MNDVILDTLAREHRFFRVNDQTSGLFCIKGVKADVVIFDAFGVEFNQKARGHRFFRVYGPTSGLFHIKGEKADFLALGTLGLEFNQKAL